MHITNSPLAWKTVKIKDEVPVIGAKEIKILNWLDRLTTTRSWKDFQEGNKAVADYALRKGCEYPEDHPEADEVLYGKIMEGQTWKAWCVHISELDIQLPASLAGSGPSPWLLPLYLSSPLTHRSMMYTNSRKKPFDHYLDRSWWHLYFGAMALLMTNNMFFRQFAFSVYVTLL